MKHDPSQLSGICLYCGAPGVSDSEDCPVRAAEARRMAARLTPAQRLEASEKDAEPEASPRPVVPLTEPPPVPWFPSPPANLIDALRVAERFKNLLYQVPWFPR